MSEPYQVSYFDLANSGTFHLVRDSGERKSPVTIASEDSGVILVP